MNDDFKVFGIKNIFQLIDHSELVVRYSAYTLETFIHAAWLSITTPKFLTGNDAWTSSTPNYIGSCADAPNVLMEWWCTQSWGKWRGIKREGPRTTCWLLRKWDDNEFQKICVGRGHHLMCLINTLTAFAMHFHRAINPFIAFPFLCLFGVLLSLDNSIMPPRWN